MAFFAAITLLGVLIDSLTSLIVSLALGAIAWNELRGGAMLRRLDPRGAARLGFNQIILGVLIVAYAAWSLSSALSTDALASFGGSTGDAQVDAMVADLSQTIAYALYASIALIGVLVPGLTAWYYFSRGPLVRTFIARTPPWVLEAMRASA